MMQVRICAHLEYAFPLSWEGNQFNSCHTDESERNHKSHDIQIQEPVLDSNEMVMQNFKHLAVNRSPERASSQAN